MQDLNQRPVSKEVNDFEMWKERFAKDIGKKNFVAAANSFSQMVLIGRSINSVTLRQQLYSSYMALADLYMSPEYWGTELNRHVLFQGFFFIPVGDEEGYQLVKKKVKELVIKNAWIILEPYNDPEKEMPIFQKTAVEDLKKMLADENTSLRHILDLMKKIIDKSSAFPFMKNTYITERGYIVDRLTALYKMIDPYVKSAEIAQAQGSASQTRERRNSIELVGMRSIPSAAPASVAAVQPLAQLVHQQRAAESAPVLRGVSSAPAADARPQGAQESKPSPRNTLS